MKFLRKFGLNANGGLLSKAAASAFMKVSGIALSFAAAAIVARSLGAAGYGIFSLAFVFSSVLGILVQFGLPNLVLRETAKAMDSHDFTTLKLLWGWAFNRIAFFSFFITTGGIATILVYFHGWTSSGAITALVALLMLPIIAVDEVKSAALRGLRYMTLGQISSLVLRPAFFIALLLVILLIDYELDPVSAMLLRVVGAACALLFIIIAFKRSAPKIPDTNLKVNTDKKKVWISVSVSMGLTAGMTQITNYADILMLGAFVPVDEVGRYRVAYQLSTLVVLGLKAISMVTAPSFARASSKSKQSELYRIAVAAARLSCFTSIITGLVLLVFGQWILTTVFGSEFQSAYFVMTLLIIGQLLNAFFGPIGMLMSMVGLEKVAAKTMMYAAAINILLNLFLIPIFGGIGAAISTFISFTFWNCTMWFVLRSKTGVRSDPLLHRKLKQS